ncbi:hypothetical protein Syun_026491 [Stephania yunnanensis]|uniref:PGG domain-containing protein n=1 Tax=Stephania yunnanensis TaxID=152371 RepID=A0AAP0EUD3_9MAGN
MEGSECQRDIREIKKALLKASFEGNVIALADLLEKHPLLLDMPITFSCETPLHIAITGGHDEFAKVILSKKPGFASEFDSEGSSPLQLACASKNIEMVKLLLTAAPDICLHKDGYRLPPLHLAAMKGNRVDILKELLQCMPQAIDIALDGGETILHLCVNHNRLEELELLLQWLDDHHHEVSINSADDRRHMVLHLAVAKKQIQITKLLLAHGVEVNALNQNGLTALDILTQSTVRDLRDMDMLEVLEGAGGLRARDGNVNNITNDARLLVVEVRDNPPGINQNIRRRTNKTGRGSEPASGKYEKDLKQQLNVMMVVASLIAGIGFQAALNPPSGLIKKPSEEGKQHTVKDAFAPSSSTIDTTDNFYYSLYMFSNAIGVLGSLAVILLVMGGLPFNGPRFVWFMKILMCGSITAMGLTYQAAIFSYSDSNDQVSPPVFRMWLGLVQGVVLLHVTRFILLFLEKKGGNKRIFLWFWCPIAFTVWVFLSLYGGWSLLAVGLMLLHVTRLLLRFVEKKGGSKRVFLCFWCPIALALVFFSDHFHDIMI